MRITGKLPALAILSQSRWRAGLLTFVISILLLNVKLAAYFITGSQAILSDALESIINVVASAFVLYTLYVSAQPPDREHPYGHGKVEFFSAGFEGALIVMAALGILYTALPALFQPPALHQLDFGIGLLAAASVVNYVMGIYLIRVGRAERSDALVADGRHVQTDAFTSFGVILGLTLVHLTGRAQLDPLIAIAVAGQILVSGWHLAKHAIGGLMNEADPDFLAQVAGALEQIRRPGWTTPHYLRSWRSGAERFIDFHLVLPRFWDLERVHAVQKVIEPALLDLTQEAGHVIIHFDPCKPRHCAVCDLPECPVRAAAFAGRPEWTVAALVMGPGLVVELDGQSTTTGWKPVACSCD